MGAPGTVIAAGASLLLVAACSSTDTNVAATGSGGGGSQRDGGGQGQSASAADAGFVGDPAECTLEPPSADVLLIADEQRLPAELAARGESLYWLATWETYWAPADGGFVEATLFECAPPRACEFEPRARLMRWDGREAAALGEARFEELRAGQGGVFVTRYDRTLGETTAGTSKVQRLDALVVDAAADADAGVVDAGAVDAVDAGAVDGTLSWPESRVHIAVSGADLLLSRTLMQTTCGKAGTAPSCGSNATAVELYSAPQDDLRAGALRPIATLTAAYAHQRMAASGDAIYLASRAALHRVDRASGLPTHTVTLPGEPTGLAASASAVYVTVESTLLVDPTLGLPTGYAADGQLLRLVPAADGGFSVETLHDGLRSPQGLSLTGEEAFVAERVPCGRVLGFSPGADAPEVLVDRQPLPTAVAVQGSSVYWATGSDARSGPTSVAAGQVLQKRR